MTFLIASLAILASPTSPQATMQSMYPDYVPITKMSVNAYYDATINACVTTTKYSVDKNEPDGDFVQMVTYFKTHQPIPADYTSTAPIKPSQGNFNVVTVRPMPLVTFNQIMQIGSSATAWTQVAMPGMNQQDKSATWTKPLKPDACIRADLINGLALTTSTNGPTTQVTAKWTLKSGTPAGKVYVVIGAERDGKDTYLASYGISVRKSSTAVMSYTAKVPNRPHIYAAVIFEGSNGKGDSAIVHLNR